MTGELPACRNCGAVLEDTYCGTCGQRGKEVRRPVIGLAQDVIIDTLSIDGKLLRSIRLLLFWPGRLAKAYIDGKRTHYTAPFRFYLFTSLVFFFALFASLDEAVAPITINGQGEPAAPTEPLDAEPPADTSEPPGETPSDASAPDDDLSIGISAGLEDSDAPEWLQQIAARMEESAERLQEDPRLFMAQIRENVPRVLLLAPVIYGLLLAIFYIYRRRFLFYDHFVTSLYMHAALYAYLGVFFAVSYLPGPFGILSWVAGLWAFIQPYAVLRQVYGSNWFSVVVKGTLINLVYWIAVSLLISVGLGYALYSS